MAALTKALKEITGRKGKPLFRRCGSRSRPWTRTRHDGTVAADRARVGCVIVKDRRVVGRGWTQPGGRPHAEAMALMQAGEAARGATAYVTLEPCAHRSPRGPACADLLIEAGVARVVAGLRDPDPRTDGEGLARLSAVGIAVECGIEAAAARRSMAGFLTRRALGRPHVTLKLATSLDGKLATSRRAKPSGSQRPGPRAITGIWLRSQYDAHRNRDRHGAGLTDPELPPAACRGWRAIRRFAWCWAARAGCRRLQNWHNLQVPCLYGR